MSIKSRNEKLGKIYFNTDDFSYSIESGIDENDFILNLKMPLRVQWRITDKCNLNCIHCYANSNINNEPLDDNKLLRIANILSKSEIFEVLISGGEVLTLKEELLYKIINKLNNKALSLFTNGVLLGKLDLSRIPKNTKFIVSIDGTKLVHNKIRNNNIFDLVLSNIRKLTAKGFSVRCNYCLMKLNKDCIPETVRLLSEAGVEVLQFAKLLPLGRADLIKNLLLTPREYKKCILIIEQLNKKFNKIKLVFNNSLFFNDKQEVDWRYCSGGTTRIEIEPNGDVYPCALIKIDSLKYGNILNDSLESIWDKRKLSIFFEEFEPRYCKKCKNYKYCFCGCRAISYLFFGDFQHGEYSCWHKNKLKN
ncbi:MAG: radical SAM protein [Candidatus Odinarchaeia archaeon]